MTGYESKRAAARDKLDDDDALTIAYQSGYYDGKKAAQPAQEPVAWGVDWGKSGDMPCAVITRRLSNGGNEVLAVEYAPYTTPPHRPWVDLTDEEIDAIYLQHHNQYDECESPNWGYERAIGAALRSKNT